VQKFLTITKALSDETRVRALLALRGGELCLCQVIELLQLSPSTVSKHMDLLYQAGLVTRRKEGRWHYFALAGREGAPEARQALRWALEALADSPVAEADGRKLCGVRKMALQEVCTCYQES